MKNIYYYPEDYDLTVVAEIDNGESYEFDKVVVWKHKDGTLYWQEDSGCSCPTPFEDYSDLASLNRVAPDLHDVENAVRSRLKQGYGGCSLGDVEKFMSDVRAVSTNVATR